jgi:hypothetical protein
VPKPGLTQTMRAAVPHFEDRPRNDPSAVEAIEPVARYEGCGFPALKSHTPRTLIGEASDTITDWGSTKVPGNSVPRAGRAAREPAGAGGRDARVRA